jgi:hypothetical protein
MLNVTFSYCYDECRHAECCYAECRHAECCYDECRHAECCSAECRGVYKKLQANVLTHFEKKS